MYGKEYLEWREDLDAKEACERDIILALIQVAKRHDPETYEAAVNRIFPKPPALVPGTFGGFGRNPLYDMLQQRQAQADPLRPGAFYRLQRQYMDEARRHQGEATGFGGAIGNLVAGFQRAGLIK